MSEWTIEGDETMRWDVIASAPSEDAFTQFKLCNGDTVSSRTHWVMDGCAVYHIDTNAFVGHLVREIPPKA